MKYFIDTEFIEGPQDKTFLGFKCEETKPTIDLISIGIVGEPEMIAPARYIPNTTNLNYILPKIHQREYYAISKDFNLKKAWKNEWVRENVLKYIFEELESKDYKENSIALQFGIGKSAIGTKFNINNLRRYINRYGKTNKQIAKEIIEFTTSPGVVEHAGIYPNTYPKESIKFYAYYADYDWVVFCQLFGTMMNLPKGFPMYAIDLKQDLDRKVIENGGEFTERLHNIQMSSNYPKQTNEHNALADAKWNYELYKFLQSV